MFESVGDPQMLANDPCLNCQRLFCDERAADCKLVVLTRLPRGYRDNTVRFSRGRAMTALQVQSARRSSREYARRKRAAKQAEFDEKMREIDLRIAEYVVTGNANWIEEFHQQNVERLKTLGTGE